MNNTKEIVLCALLSALLVVSKELLAFLPNIELVTFLVLVYTCHFKYIQNVIIVNVFCLMEMVLYGFGLWTIPYFVSLNVLVLFATYLPVRYKTCECLAIVSGVFGLIFDLFFSVPYFMLSFSTGVSYLMQGLFFSVVHMVGNYIVMLVLFDPVNRLMKKMNSNDF